MLRRIDTYGNEWGNDSRLLKNRLSQYPNSMMWARRTMPPLPSLNHNVVPNLKLETLLTSLRQLSPVAQKASILWPGIGSLGSPPSHASDIWWKSSRLHSVDFLASSLAPMAVPLLAASTVLPHRRRHHGDRSYLCYRRH